MAQSKSLYHVRFVEQQQVYDIYAKKVSQSHLSGFLEVSEFVFSADTSLVIDPAEQRLKDELSEVERLFIPIYAVFRLEQVTRRGIAKIKRLDIKSQGNISHFPGVMVPSSTQGEQP